MSTHPEFVIVETHYGLTRDEFASRAGKHKSCFDDRLRPVCGNGSFHAKCTRDKSKVDCPACLAKLKQSAN